MFNNIDIIKKIIDFKQVPFLKFDFNFVMMISIFGMCI